MPFTHRFTVADAPRVPPPGRAGCPSPAQLAFPSRGLMNIAPPAPTLHTNQKATMRTTVLFMILGLAAVASAQSTCVAVSWLGAESLFLSTAATDLH
jgi:hypothetical protein